MQLLWFFNSSISKAAVFCYLKHTNKLHMVLCAFSFFLFNHMLNQSFYFFTGWKVVCYHPWTVYGIPNVLWTVVLQEIFCFIFMYLVPKCYLCFLFQNFELEIVFIDSYDLLKTKMKWKQGDIFVIESGIWKCKQKFLKSVSQHEDYSVVDIRMTGNVFSGAVCCCLVILLYSVTQFRQSFSTNTFKKINRKVIESNFSHTLKSSYGR